MDSKRDLDGEKRLIRNEKARRRRALQYACRYLPIELEKKIFNYMKNPRNGRIDVSMKWQKHPVAKIISQYAFNLRIDSIADRFHRADGTTLRESLNIANEVIPEPESEPEPEPEPEIQMVLESGPDSEGGTSIVSRPVHMDTKYCNNRRGPYF